MTNPFDWKTEHLVGWLVSIGIGAVLALILRYFVDPRAQFVGWGLTDWVRLYPVEALTWGLLGGFVVGGVVYAVKVLSAN